MCDGHGFHGWAGYCVAAGIARVCFVAWGHGRQQAVRWLADHVALMLRFITCLITVHDIPLLHDIV